MTKLKTDNNAIVKSTTQYLKNIHSAIDYPHKIIKPSTNAKLGKKITKGIWKDKKIYTLTLVERATCTSDCEHWLDCYGNNMPFAHRFKTDKEHGVALMKRIWEELEQLNNKHKQGFVVRLHVLGDFFSWDYVDFWRRAIEHFGNLFVYGYTRWHPNTNIGNAVYKVRNKHLARFKIRFSNLPSDKFSASSSDFKSFKASQNKKDNINITCPVQLNKTDSCGTCGLCWTAQTKPIIFITH